MPEPREKGVRDVSDLVVSALEELLQLVPVPPYSSSSLENSASEIGYENLRKPQTRDDNDIFFPLELELGAVLRIPSVQHVNIRLIG